MMLARLNRRSRNSSATRTFSLNTRQTSEQRLMNSSFKNIKLGSSEELNAAALKFILIKLKKKRKI